jgi:two-component system chemotaxis sensor kinase CheA
VKEEQKKIRESSAHEPAKVESKPQKTDKKPTQKHHVEQLIRVPLSKLDKLMNLVGELVIYRTELQVAKERGSQDALEGVIERIGRSIIELQNEVMSMRMTPMAFVFNRFPRMVRDLAKRFGKKVKFIIEGAETEIDRSILDKLGDPLVHLLRNAIDHGIEPPEERIAAGKPEEGHLWLRAYAEGNYVFIEVEDDGRGIDPEKVKKKAIERGIISPDEAENLSKREIYELLFRPGFSTAEKVTDVSGRGVGLDVVKAVIEQLGGSIEVQSEIGKGTKFVLRLPLTLAIITALLVTVGSEVYAIPLGSVDEVVEKDERLKKTQVGEVFLLRGDVLPVYYMSKIFNVPDAGEGSHLVVVRGAGTRAALVIDDLIGQQEIVIKPLKGRYVSVPYISGATILGRSF